MKFSSDLKKVMNELIKMIEEERFTEAQVLWESSTVISDLKFWELSIVRDRIKLGEYFDNEF